MKRIFVLLPIVLIACEFFPKEPVLSPPAPEYTGEPIISFSFNNSRNFPGYVRFKNTSKGIKSFTWDFGFIDYTGKTFTSHEVSPNVKYPNNGTYQVTLSGIGNDEKEYSIRQPVAVGNN